jgi:hypothetical protein
LPLQLGTALAQGLLQPAFFHDPPGDAAEHRLAALVKETMAILTGTSGSAEVARRRAVRRGRAGRYGRR